ncbi:hypothetical protein HDU93_009248 [Gonapodya sp. JEL0774]|nr:hypothetical protein HDU93_009248 [Gonapodya sp. JEL0774]
MAPRRVTLKTLFENVEKLASRAEDSLLDGKLEQAEEKVVSSIIESIKENPETFDGHDLALKLSNLAKQNAIHSTCRLLAVLIGRAVGIYAQELTRSDTEAMSYESREILSIELLDVLEGFIVARTIDKEVLGKKLLRSLILTFMKKTAPISVRKQVCFGGCHNIVVRFIALLLKAADVTSLLLGRCKANKEVVSDFRNWTSKFLAIARDSGDYSLLLAIVDILFRITPKPDQVEERRKFIEECAAPVTAGFSENVRRRFEELEAGKSFESAKRATVEEITKENDGFEKCPLVLRLRNLTFKEDHLHPPMGSEHLNLFLNRETLGFAGKLNDSEGDLMGDFSYAKRIHSWREMMVVGDDEQRALSIQLKKAGTQELAPGETLVLEFENARDCQLAQTIVKFRSSIVRKTSIPISVSRVALASAASNRKSPPWKIPGSASETTRALSEPPVDSQGNANQLVAITRTRSKSEEPQSGTSKQGERDDHKKIKSNIRQTTQAKKFERLEEKSTYGSDVQLNTVSVQMESDDGIAKKTGRSINLHSSDIKERDITEKSKRWPDRTGGIEQQPTQAFQKVMANDNKSPQQASGRDNQPQKFLAEKLQEKGGDDQLPKKDSSKGRRGRRKAVTSQVFEQEEELVEIPSRHVQKAPLPVTGDEGENDIALKVAPITGGRAMPKTHPQGEKVGRTRKTVKQPEVPPSPSNTISEDGEDVSEYEPTQPERVKRDPPKRSPTRNPIRVAESLKETVRETSEKLKVTINTRKSLQDRMLKGRGDMSVKETNGLPPKSAKFELPIRKPTSAEPVRPDFMTSKNVELTSKALSAKKREETDRIFKSIQIAENPPAEEEDELTSSDEHEDIDEFKVGRNVPAPLKPFPNRTNSRVATSLKRSLQHLFSDDKGHNDEDQSALHGAPAKKTKKFILSKRRLEKDVLDEEEENPTQHVSPSLETHGGNIAAQELITKLLGGLPIANKHENKRSRFSLSIRASDITSEDEDFDKTGVGKVEPHPLPTKEKPTSILQKLATKRQQTPEEDEDEPSVDSDLEETERLLNNSRRVQARRKIDPTREKSTKLVNTKTDRLKVTSRKHFSSPRDYGDDCVDDSEISTVFEDLGKSVQRRIESKFESLRGIQEQSLKRRPGANSYSTLKRKKFLHDYSAQRVDLSKLVSGYRRKTDTNVDECKALLNLTGEWSEGAKVKGKAKKK